MVMKKEMVQIVSRVYLKWIVSIHNLPSSACDASLHLAYKSIDMNQLNGNYTYVYISAVK